MDRAAPSPFARTGWLERFAPFAKVGPFANGAPVALLFIGSYAYRLPALLNARSTNSDAAVVGLQAMHLLRGEFSPFLWGSGYQTSVDSFVAAAWFAVLGASPLVLMLSALTLHVGSTLMTFDLLRRRLPRWSAFLATLPLVVSPSSVHSYALYPPRQASLTMAMAAFWILGRRGGPAPPTFAVAGLLATLAVSADPYPLVLLPAIGVFALLSARLPPARSAPAIPRLAAFAAGSAIGLLPFWRLHRLAGAKSGPLTFTTSMLEHHARLLWEECLPWALSYKVYYAHFIMDYRPWAAPRSFVVLGALGALILGGLVAYGLVARVLPSMRGRPELADLGAAGAVTFPVALGGFLVSVMAMDHFSMRYLAVLTLMTPFAVTPAAFRLGTARFGALFAPHLIASAIAGWVGYGPFVRGPTPVREVAELHDDEVLLQTLAERRVEHAEADYWTAYRLTFLARERLTVVPINASEDRYPPYRQAFDRATRFAYVFDPGRSREDPAVIERALRDAAATHGSVEPLTIGRLRVFLVTR